MQGWHWQKVQKIKDERKGRKNVAKYHKHIERMIEEMNKREGMGAVGVKINKLIMGGRDNEKVSED